MQDVAADLQVGLDTAHLKVRGYSWQGRRIAMQDVAADLQVGLDTAHLKVRGYSWLDGDLPYSTGGTGSAGGAGVGAVVCVCVEARTRSVGVDFTSAVDRRCSHAASMPRDSSVFT